MFKYSNILVLVSSLVSLPAYADYIELAGDDVIYSIDTDTAWLSGLTPVVHNNTLLMTASNGEAIKTIKIQGKGTHSAEARWISADTDKNGEDVFTIQVAAKPGRAITAARAEMDITARGQINGTLATASGNNSFSRRNSPDSFYEGATEYQEWRAGASSTQNGEAPITQFGKAPSWRATDPGYDYYRPVTTPEPFHFWTQISAEIRGSSSNDSFVEVSLNSFGVTMQVAPVPEPETYALLGLGMVGLVSARRRQRKT